MLKKKPYILCDYNSFRICFVLLHLFEQAIPESLIFNQFSRFYPSKECPFAFNFYHFANAHTSFAAIEW